MRSETRRDRHRAEPIAALIALMLTGCAGAQTTVRPDDPIETPAVTESASATPASPAPSPSPTRLALSELVVTEDGLGPLVLGDPPDDNPATRLVAIEENACTTHFGVAPGHPLADLWRTDPAYAATSGAFGTEMSFGVGVDHDSGVLSRVELNSSDIATDGGVRIGDDGSRVAVAHPDASVVLSAFTEIYVVTGQVGTLQIEVAKTFPADSLDRWGEKAGTVVFIRAVSLDKGVFSVAFTDDLVGNGCGP